MTTVPPYKPTTCLGVPKGKPVVPIFEWPGYDGTRPDTPGPDDRIPPTIIVDPFPEPPTPENDDHIPPMINVDPFHECPVPADDRLLSPTIIVDPYPAGPNTPSPDNDEDDNIFQDEDDEDSPFLSGDDGEDDEGDIHGTTVQDPASEIEPVVAVPETLSAPPSSPVEAAPEANEMKMWPHPLPRLQSLPPFLYQKWLPFPTKVHPL